MKYFSKRFLFICFWVPVLLIGTMAGCTREETKVLMEDGGDYTEAEANQNIQTEFDNTDSQKEPGSKDTGEGLGPVTASRGAAQDPEQSKIWVDICGEVNAPGVYRMDAGDRLYQLVEKAGGFTEAAARSSVNQARVLTDGEQIIVLNQEEFSQAGVERQAENKSVSQDKIDLNTAGEEELTGLNGIGPSKAAAIVAYRKEHGGFSSIQEITEVEGIGSGTFEKIKDDIVVS